MNEKCDFCEEVSQDLEFDEEWDAVLCGKCREGQQAELDRVRREYGIPKTVDT